ncbi:Uncharacterized protein OS=Sorangium cellulosum (strain So ce56) GN=sce5710 PE=4 SV=1 [Gemmata massiliana]|uniref:SMI1/KNR4 family protein n=1 Tax=Gemmata massiliana TaxID=1210884 RepID=A0A6P2DLB5_9BACT|nr:hypothetical protein [Gemmata massiliana]VTS03599.1 Uncharacterized protein OS=Sorangium cellulosum (strain So ce56) GN=sce5710 PE=4 SV=1 [Gemmata massiliana]
MTEGEWLGDTVPNPAGMLVHLRKCVPDRKLRLVACACCRRNRLFMTQCGADALVRATEQWAEGTADRGTVVEAFGALKLAPSAHELTRRSVSMEHGFCSGDAFTSAMYTVHWAMDEEPATQRWLADLIRDAFGNPFRPAPFYSSWRSSTAVALASQMYESRDFGAMPILADALQDAGCDSADVLDHCRGSGPHVRGCWVVDLVLGKE